MNNNLKFVFIGDLHFGAMPPAKLETEIAAVILKWANENKFDAIIQGGDWFDKRLSLDSEDAKAAIRTVVEFCRLCEKRNVPFRIINGTASHDQWQLENFRPLEKEFSTFKVIETAQHEELIPGFDVLWMPEEYPRNYDSFYGPLLEDEGGSLVYDGIFGHGEIDVAAGWGGVTESERVYGGTPCHSSEMLLSHSSGPVWFAHIHTRFRYKKRLGYPGSFSRWAHGEEISKGFDVLELTKTNEGWDVKPIVVTNVLAPKYHQIKASEVLTEGQSVADMITVLKEASIGFHRFRVIMDDFQISLEETALLRGAFIDNHGIEIKGGLKLASAAINEETEIAAATLKYLRDQSISGEQRLLMYIKERYPAAPTITIDDVCMLTASLT